MELLRGVLVHSQNWVGESPEAVNSAAGEKPQEEGRPTAGNGPFRILGHCSAEIPRSTTSSVQTENTHTTQTKRVA